MTFCPWTTSYTKYILDNTTMRTSDLENCLNQTTGRFEAFFSPMRNKIWPCFLGVVANWKDRECSVRIYTENKSVIEADIQAAIWVPPNSGAPCRCIECDSLKLARIKFSCDSFWTTQLIVSDLRGIEVVLASSVEGSKVFMSYSSFFTPQPLKTRPLRCLKTLGYQPVTWHQIPK
jgi:hypothetical protein